MSDVLDEERPDKDDMAAIMGMHSASLRPVSPSVAGVGLLAGLLLKHRLAEQFEHLKRARAVTRAAVAGWSDFAGHENRELLGEIEAVLDEISADVARLQGSNKPE